MTYTINDKYQAISKDIVKETSNNPITIVKSIMSKDYINIHGIEHHFLDGAAFLVAYKNAGGEIDLTKALTELGNRSIAMPGAMCGYWGICGSAASVGASLAIIHSTNPLSADSYYSDHMELTSIILKEMSILGGPRCCKRNAFISLRAGAKYVKDKYRINMVADEVICTYSAQNAQCIKSRCPFFKEENKVN